MALLFAMLRLACIYKEQAGHGTSALQTQWFRAGEPGGCLQRRRRNCAHRFAAQAGGRTTVGKFPEARNSCVVAGKRTQNVGLSMAGATPCLRGPGAESRDRVLLAMLASTSHVRAQRSIPNETCRIFATVAASCQSPSFIRV